MIFNRTRLVAEPRRANPTDAGIDFFVPEYDPELAGYIKDNSQSVAEVSTFGIVLNPGDNVLIPLGIKVMVDAGTALIAFNKSGIASKKGLHVGACVVDQGYEGEVHLNVANVSKEPALIEFGSKAIQFIQMKIEQHIPTEVDADEYAELCRQDNENTTRGADGFGSTGN